MSMSIGRLPEETQGAFRAKIVDTLQETGYGDRADKVLRILEEYGEKYGALIAEFESRLISELGTNLIELSGALSKITEEMHEL